MRLPFFCALSLLASLPATAQGTDSGDYPFSIERINAPQSVRFVAVNGGPATLTVFFELEGNNFHSDKNLPLTLVIAPDSAQDLVSLTQEKRWEPLRHHARASFSPGDAFTPHDKSARYWLPFAEGTPLSVVQEPNGTLVTHNNRHARYAVDFGVPEGTLVTAARDGTVIDIKDSFTEGRPDPSLSEKANLVAVMHDDRSIGYYLHLAPQRVLVKVGERVRAGSALAYSGNTGYTYGAHLHFDVRRAAVTEQGEVIHVSVPINFYRRNGAGTKIEIKEGLRMKAE